MRAIPPALAALVLLPSASAQARIAVEPLREVLRSARPDLVACRARGRLPAGRYRVRILLSARTGKAAEVEVLEAPDAITEADESCLVAAYARLAYPTFERAARPSTAAPASPPSSVWFRGRRGRVPGRARPPSPEWIVVVWPLHVVAEPRGPPRPETPAAGAPAAR